MFDDVLGEIFDEKKPMKDNRPLLTLAAIALAGFLVGTGWTLRGCHDAPPAPPDVVVPEVVEGPRTVLIVNETLDRTPEVAAIFTQLRAGDAAKYLAEKGHTLTILDDDASNPDGKPAEVLEKYRADFTNVGLPCVLVVHPESGRVMGAAKLPETADGVIELLRQHGG